MLHADPFRIIIFELKKSYLSEFEDNFGVAEANDEDGHEVSECEDDEDVGGG